MLDKERVKSHITDFLRDYYQVQNVSKNFSCIFGTHPDRHPSMSLNTEGKYVKCFSCGEAADIFTLAQHYFKLDFAAAAKKLEELYPDCVLASGIEKPQMTNRYFASRGLTDETVRHYGAVEVDSYQAAYHDKNGVLKYFPFGPAICIPPERDAPAAMIRSTQEKKFYKPAGQKEQLFFSSELDQPEPVFITESVLCAMTIYQEGGHAIPLNGLGSAAFLQEVKTRTSVPKFILTLDQDDAGKKASSELYNALQELGLDCIEFSVSGTKKDPNEFFLSDPASFRSLIQQGIASAKSGRSSSNRLLDYISYSFLSDLKNKQQHISDRKTGFIGIDQTLGGLQEGLYVFGGRPGIGKTTFIDQLAYSVSTDVPVYFFTYEQSKIHFAAKQLGRLSYLMQKQPLKSSDILKGIYDDRLLAVMKRYLDDNRKLYLYSEQYTVDQIKKIMLQAEDRLGVSPILIVDYVQKIPCPGKNPREAIDQILSEFSAFTHQEARTTILISSFNRAAYYAPLSMDSYKESGNVEYAADFLLGLQPKILSDPVFLSEGRIAEKNAMLKQAEKRMPRELELVCVKNKYGSLFSSPLLYYTEYDYFKDGCLEKKKRL